MGLYIFVISLLINFYDQLVKFDKLTKYSLKFFSIFFNKQQKNKFKGFKNKTK